jgi:hypothetical protein
MMPALTKINHSVWARDRRRLHSQAFAWETAVKMLEKQHALKIPQKTITSPCKEERNRHTLEKIS